ncbi:hypothetical protein FJ970_32945 (plasmid) [Mesorhizobium sp. B2-1-8]|uniref:hypothetical protein n=1 Tax=Mesorhizobium sp. B2-1-8 TaxID=2589967 RepID=UPI0015E3ACE7|nr:hypothetical protein [Mesorhizobium sp. B2-1-8]UCI22731.1 hypothetical protein FJ970_32945 [Mesorhizobium sp. B2-1-8]
MTKPVAQPKAALAFAGGGSFGAIEVAVLSSLARRGIAADMVVDRASEPDTHRDD